MHQPHMHQPQPSPPLQYQFHDGIFMFPVVPLAPRRAAGCSLKTHQVNGLHDKDIECPTEQGLSPFFCWFALMRRVHCSGLAVGSQAEKGSLSSYSSFCGRSAGTPGNCPPRSPLSPFLNECLARRMGILQMVFISQAHPMMPSRKPLK